MVKMKKEPTCKVNDDGSKHWILDGELHREDGPAIIHYNGTEYWYNNGLLHREDGPAQIFPEGENTWWLNNQVYDFNVWCKTVKLSREEIIEMKLLYV